VSGMIWLWWKWRKNYVWTLNKIWTQVFHIVIHLTQGCSNFSIKTQARPTQLSCWSAFHPRKHLRYPRWQARDDEPVHTHCHGRNDRGVWSADGDLSAVVCEAGEGEA